MKILTTLAIGAAVVLGTIVAFGKNNRFLGDKAEKGDTAFVPVSVLAAASSSPEVAVAARLAAETGAANVGILVQSETGDTVTGKVVALQTAATTNVVPPGIGDPIGLITVKKADVVALVRGGVAVIDSSAKKAA